jgi:hypothetical protein
MQQFPTAKFCTNVPVSILAILEICDNYERFYENICEICGNLRISAFSFQPSTSYVHVMY